MTDETRARFLSAIAAHIPIERIAEVHLFPAIRQGGMESGVAVVAVERIVESTTASVAEPVTETPTEQASEPESEPALDGAIEPAPEIEEFRRPVAPQRYTIFSSRYRHTLKGPDRGKWEVAVTEEADAPLLTVDAVVRGVQRRSGDAEEIVRLSGDEVRSMLATTAPA